MVFYCPSRFIERPELLIKALEAHEVKISFDRSTLRGVAAIDVEPLGDSDRYEAFCFVLRTNRFRANLSVSDVNGLPVIDGSPFVEQLVEVLTPLGIVPVPSPVEEELDFAERQFGEKPGVAELIAEIRDRQQKVAQSVQDQAFESAAKFADQRDTLLDQLYKSCTT